MRFEPGDIVIPARPDNYGESPIWIDRMDRWDGMECEVENHEGFYVKLKGCNWKFNTKWLTLVDKKEGKYASVCRKIRQMDKRFAKRQHSMKVDEYAHAS